MMTTSNSKHAIANRTTTTNQLFIPSLGLNRVVPCVFTISSYATVRSSVKFLIHLQCFKYSPVSQYLSHLQAHVLGFPT